MLLTKLRLSWLDIGQVIVLYVLLDQDVVEPACVKESFNFGSKLIPLYLHNEGAIAYVPWKHYVSDKVDIK